MATKLEQYAEIEALVKKTAEDTARKVYAEEATKYGVAKTPLHRHNGADSPTIGNGSINNFYALPATPVAPLQTNGIQNGGGDPQVPVPGVLWPELLGLQTVDNPADAQSQSDPSNVWVMPIPSIQGFGTTTNLTMTATRPQGATTATLTALWGGTTGRQLTKFSTGEQRDVLYTNGSASISWTPGLYFATSSAAITIIANARFKGGEAPLGSMIMFTNYDDGIRQLWVRADIQQEPVDRWYGFNFAETAP